LGRFADGLTDQQRRGLDQLLEVRSGGGQSTLAWLRQTAYAATTGNFPKLIDRLKQVRVLGIESERATSGSLLRSEASFLNEQS
jgi:hypothetical protein